MTSISTNFTPTVTPAIQKNTTQPKIDTKPTEKTGMSKAAKVGIGAAAVATAVIAGLAIKNKAATKKALKALEKEAQDLGISAKSLDILKKNKIQYEKCENIDFSDVLKRIDKVAETSSSKIQEVMLLSPNSVKKAYKLDDVSDKSFLMVFKLNNGKIRQQLVMPDKYGESFINTVSSEWSKNKNVVIPIAG